MLLVYINFSLQFYIKHFYDNLYIGGKVDVSDYTPVEPEGITERGDFQIEYNKDGLLLIKPKFGNKTWDIGDEWTLTYWRRHGEPNQLFYFDYLGPFTYAIKNRGKCLEYNSSTKRYIASKCNYTANQRFAFIRTLDEERSRTF
ncbi:hypothetical protein NCER_100578 [Vairimorpha ceranae BRL01]|uniref:Ricin B lectin domain-containing protein n=2 Tax=Vairimorpha ceranae TaxID=40302 RepID=C4V7Y2_VAIC1|nr:hypothetical protein AAJ76_1000013104 [Vairimorpha ceranae]EEQ82671.1 hypothetical protein NCER_100578 [Vairimorpha ceranae BRL01]KAF5141546.1 hypothetical protein G9O61_00g002850 [Vairimorpha ceranae]KKO75862.1 hypothetical protein AAJ76_1000013104 [Vairimorpha ceranae]